MRILLVVANFIPEIGSAAHIYFDLATAFVKKGHVVDVITSYPREFNLDKADRGREFSLEKRLTASRSIDVSTRQTVTTSLSGGWNIFTFLIITSGSTARTARSTMSAYSTYRHFPCITLQRRSSGMTGPPLS